MVGESEATYDWPAYQPVSANEPARYLQHSFFSLFDLPEAPSGLHALKGRGPFPLGIRVIASDVPTFIMTYNQSTIRLKA